jgi:hypothetical protein
MANDRFRSVNFMTSSSARLTRSDAGARTFHLNSKTLRDPHSRWSAATYDINKTGGKSMSIRTIGRIGTSPKPVHGNDAPGISCFEAERPRNGCAAASAKTLMAPMGRGDDGTADRTTGPSILRVVPLTLDSVISPASRI